MGKWIRYRRKGGKTPDPVSRISIRANAIALNAHFVATAGLEKMSHVSIFADPELFRLGFRFHAGVCDEDAIALTRDGGGRGRGRSIQVAGLMRANPWLAALANVDDQRLRRFEPKWVNAESMWVISLRPAFEHRVSDKSNIPSRACGIYRYKRGEEIVYIGRGQIRSRLSAPDRDDWDFETIDYSLIADEAEQAKWESFWLDEFVGEHGKLPIYNRVSGKRPKDT